MKHYSTARWCDYVRGLAAAGPRREMERHLEAGCPRCGPLASSLVRVAALAESERAAAPPAGAVRSAKALFGLERGIERRGAATRALELLLDSRRQPALGLRGAAARSSRNLVYTSERLTLSLEIRRDAKRAALRIGGELVDRSPAPVPDVPVLLLAGRRLAAQALSNRHGRFRLLLEERRPPPLRLFIPLTDDVCYELAVPVTGG